MPLATPEAVGGAAGQIVRDATTIGYVAVTYATTMTPDLTVGIQKIVVTDGVAFTIAGTGAKPNLGGRVVFDIANSSGGAHGAITWGTTYKLAGALAAIADTKRKTITFYWDGTNMVEVARAAADI